jgi:hypothetical protein
MEESELIQEINSLTELEEVSSPPTTSDLNEYSDISYHYFKKEFGGWTEALEEAGFTPSKNQYNSKVSREELLEEIVRLSEEHCEGEPPRERDVEDFSKYSIRPFYTEFGKWNDALEASNIDGVYQYKDIPRKDLIESIKNVFEEHGVLLKEDFVKHSEYSLNPYDRRFGGFANAVIEAGYEPRRYRGIPIDKLKEEIKRLSDDIGETPSFNDMENKGKFSSEVYHRRFGSWNNALRASGFETYTYPKGEKHPNWKGGINKYYGPSWYGQKEKTKERDEYSCRLCFNSEDTPSVHHITPSRYWVVEKEHKKMNNLQNLICLCRSCHHKLEGEFKGRNHEQFEELARQYLDKENR